MLVKGAQAEGYVMQLALQGQWQTTKTPPLQPSHMHAISPQRGKNPAEKAAYLLPKKVAYLSCQKWQPTPRWRRSSRQKKQRKKKKEEAEEQNNDKNNNK